ncbi:hypothetical protein P153DRAFT_350031, partial [Dothidotthia symphoricarpi CBS 119687]
MEAPKGPRLLQQAEKILLHPVHANLISYCPTMDLVAVVTDEENLDVYRINGQRAFGVKRKSEDVAVDAMQWEENGKRIAISWSDGSTDLVSVETGKVGLGGLTLGVGDDTVQARVKCMGWGVNFIDVEGVKRRIGSGKTNVDFDTPTTEGWDDFKNDATLEDFLQRQPDLQNLDIAPDLPDQLAMMDMETLLPKLPAIPLPPAMPFMRVAKADSGAFGSQAEVDALLHSHHLKDHNSVDMFIRCSDQGTVHPSIYDSLETVSVRLPTAWNVETTPMLHANHPYSCTHGLLVQTATRTRQKHIAFVPLTLNFIPSAGIYLHLIASKTSQLQNLMLYMTQCLQRIRTFFKHAQDLPSKFMMNISETLEEKGQGDLVTNLFHIACTGNCPPLVREWLVDELAEQGHKRWDNIVTSSLTTLLALVHENLIPAIDRCAIVISRLRGLAQFHDRDWIFSCPITDFTALVETLKSMRLLAHTVLLYAADEKRQFHAFSKWLRFCIDYEATEPESQSRAEMEMRDPGVDIGMVLEYIRYGLTKSSLSPHLRPEAQLSSEQRGQEVASYEDTRKAIELSKEGAGFKEEALCLEFVAGHLGEGVTKLLKQVSQWQETNTQMDCGIVLEETHDTEDLIADMRMLSELSRPAISTYIALCSPSSPDTLHIHRLTHTPRLTSLPKDLHSHSTSTLTFPQDTKIIDAKFADDTTILVLLHCSSPDSNLILALPYTSTPTPSSTSAPTPLISYTPTPHPPHTLPHGAPPPPSSRAKTHITPQIIEKHTRHVFEGRFTPLKLVVNGRKGRRVIVVLGSDRKHYRVLDMDFAARKEGGGEAETGDVGESSEGEEGADRDGDVDMGGA